MKSNKLLNRMMKVSFFRLLTKCILIIQNKQKYNDKDENKNKKNETK